MEQLSQTLAAQTRQWCLVALKNPLKDTSHPIHVSSSQNSSFSATLKVSGKLLNPSPSRKFFGGRISVALGVVLLVDLLRPKLKLEVSGFEPENDLLSRCISTDADAVLERLVFEGCFGVRGLKLFIYFNS